LPGFRIPPNLCLVNEVLFGLYPAIGTLFTIVLMIGRRREGFEPREVAIFRAINAGQLRDMSGLSHPSICPRIADAFKHTEHAVAKRIWAGTTP